MSQIRPRSNTEILDASFEIYRRNFSGFFTLALLTAIPSVLMGIMIMPTSGERQSSLEVLISAMEGTNPEMSVTFMALLIASYVFFFLAFSASTFMAADAYTGSRPDLGSALSTSVKPLGVLFLALITTWIAITVGFFLLIIPGFIFLIWFSLTFTTIVLERRGPIDGMTRSRDLTRSSKGRVFLILLALFAVSVIIQIIATMLLIPIGVTKISYAIISVISSLAYPLYGIVLTILFFDLRLRKEGAPESLSDAEGATATPQPSVA